MGNGPAMTEPSIQTPSDLPPKSVTHEAPAADAQANEGDLGDGPNPILAYHRPRVLMALTALSGYLIIHLLSTWLRLPAATDRSPSILLNQPWGLALPVLFIGLILSAAVGSLIGGRVRPDAGLIAAAFGLLAMSIRSGTVRFAFLSGKGASVYAIMAMEMVLLYVMLLFIWIALRWMVQRKYLPEDVECDEMSANEDKLVFRLIALGTQVAVMAIVVLMVGQSDRKFQALAAIGLGSFAGTIVAHTLFSVQPSVWFWAGSLVTGLIGYFLALANPGLWIIGKYASPLVTGTPLDYASAGVIGALIGYWMSRNWRLARLEA